MFSSIVKSVNSNGTSAPTSSVLGVNKGCYDFAIGPCNRKK